MSSNMSRIRANFLLAFAAWRTQNGHAESRPNIVEREEILKFQNSWTDGQTGPLGKTLRPPSWLTAAENNPYRVSRGVYKMPWAELDAAMSVWSAAPASTPASSGTTVADATSEVSTDPVNV